MEGDKGRICVTGGTGYIGSWIIKLLLEQGYSVNTTVRSRKDVSFLTSLPGASQKLDIFEADLSEPDSFNAAIEGCSGVFHVASPIDFEGRETEEVVTNRTINGALGILEACLNSNTVKRIVYTSSASAVVFNGKNIDVMNESFWSEVEYTRALKSYASSYMISKTLAERAVLDFAEQHGLNVATVIPSFVLGPFICPKLPASVHISLGLVFGNKDHYSQLTKVGMVHVDDVARAHIFLHGHPDLKGRYNCSSEVITIEAMHEFLSAKYPEFQLTSLDILKEMKGPKFPALTSKKLMDAGFSFQYRVDKMFEEAIQCCKEMGYL